ncbi:MAG: glutamate--tRNA ligase [Blastopirellula sp.]|nr:MAG: glutamate--tRNA ligase [Blastopirellula sp.]
MTVRTRFAPSPTGYLHIGGVRTALFNWLYARRHGGQFVLRIDDTDQQRNVDEALEPILHGFKWLGMDWDEGPDVDGPYAPYYQSQRQERYQAAAQKLIDDGLAYYDYSTNEEVQGEREAAQAEKRPFQYSRKWMAETEEQRKAFEAEGRSFVVRLKMPREGKCEFTDLVRGELSFDWALENDHVIQRSDGSCLYHLASVVDDYEFKISHVIRAEEHLPNTPRQIFIGQSLGFTIPEYAHLPYVAEPGSKRKLSKRKLEKYLKNPDFKKLNEHGQGIAERMNLTTTADSFNPVIVDFYEQVGYLPEAILNYLVLLGWSLDDKTEDFTVEEMIANFSLERVTKAPASFDGKKLFAFQDRYIQKLPLKQKTAKMLPYLQKAGLVAEPTPCDVGPKLGQIIEACGDRLKVAGDIIAYADYFFVADEDMQYDEKGFQKRLCKAGAKENLAKFREALAATDDWSKENLDKVLHQFVEAAEIKIGEIIHALRMAITGKPVGPGMFDCLAIIGKESCLKRIDQTLAKIDASCAS